MNTRSNRFSSLFHRLVGRACHRRDAAVEETARRDRILGRSVSRVVEQLEGRTLFSALPALAAFAPATGSPYVNFNVATGLMTIVGTVDHDVANVAPVAGGGIQVNVVTTNGAGLSKVLNQVFTAAPASVGFVGFDGNDSFRNGILAPSTADGGTGTDTLTGGSLNDYFSGGTGDDTLTGNLGNDELSGDGGLDTIRGNDGTDTLEGGDEFDTIEGGRHVDTINGDAGDDDIWGGDGNDVIHGNDGFDEIWGDNDQDTLYGDEGADTIYCGSGEDTADGGTENDLIYGDSGPDTLDGSEHDDVIYGGTDPDIIHGDEGNDTLNGDGQQDRIWGDAGNDSLFGGDDIDTLRGGTENDDLHGGSGNDSLRGEDHNDRLYGDAGNDTSLGGSGDDTLVSIGGGVLDVNTGNDGSDSFWVDFELTETITDASVSETDDGHVHRVLGFMDYTFPDGTIEGVTRELTGQEIPDPCIMSDDVANGAAYVEYSNVNFPLFSPAGPVMTDVVQGGVGDCYFLASVAGYVNEDPDLVRQAVVDLGDGSYAARFYDGGMEVYVRVDGDLPTDDGNLIYGQVGAGNSIWGPVLEKAWAVFRDGVADYANIAGGTGKEVAEAFDFTYDNRSGLEWTAYNAVRNADGFFDDAAAALAANDVVTVSTDTNAVTVVGNHLYTVIGLDEDNGVKLIQLYNPWGEAEWFTMDSVYADMDGFCIHELP